MEQLTKQLSLYGWLSAKLQITYADAKRLMRGFKDDTIVYNSIMELYLIYYHGSFMAMQENEVRCKFKSKEKLFI